MGPAGKHDFACIMSTLKCETLRYTRPNTHFTSLVEYNQCDRVFSTTTTTTNTLPPPAPVYEAPQPEDKASWSGGPAEWGLVQWIVLSVPFSVICFAGSFVYCFLRKRRAQQLKRVHVAPKRDGENKIQWDLADAGRVSMEELQKVSKAIKDAEKSNGKESATLGIAFGVSNDLRAEHLKVLGTMLDRHAKVSVSLDTDWRFADDACIKALTTLLKRRERCILRAPGMGEGLSTLKLPLDCSPAVVEGLVDSLTTSVHSEVDAIAFALPGSWPPPYSVKGSPVVALTQLRLSCQELVLRRCVMADLGTVAVCAFVRPWAARIQIMRLTECEIGDEGAAALSRLIG